jgi:hypothetical protein
MVQRENNNNSKLFNLKNSGALNHVSRNYELLFNIKLTIQINY